MDKGSNLPTLFIILLAMILPLLWNILTVFYLARKARNGMLSPLRFSLAFVLGFSITVSTILFIVIAAANGIDLRKMGFVFFVAKFSHWFSSSQLHYPGS